MSQFNTIEVEIESNGQATLWLNRPDKHNALNAEMIQEIHAAADVLAAADGVRVVVLAARGKSFCAGGDLNWMRAQAERDRVGRIEEATALAEMLKALDELPKPVIGRVQGAAYGGGIGMMAVCDTVIAAQESRFALTETRLGLIPATIGPYLVRRMGEGNARRVFLTGTPFTSSEAISVGLVSRTVAAEALDEAVAQEVGYALACAPGAVAEAKQMLFALSREGLDDPVRFSAEALADRWDSPEAQTGIAAFFAKKNPPWARGK